MILCLNFKENREGIWPPRRLFIYSPHRYKNKGYDVYTIH